MKLGLINSAWLGTFVGTAEGIRKTKEIGFDSIDIFNDPMVIDIKERRLIKDTCREVGLSKDCLHSDTVVRQMAERCWQEKRIRRTRGVATELTRDTHRLRLLLGLPWDSTSAAESLDWSAATNWR